jgi:hypothetical protein
LSSSGDEARLRDDVRGQRAHPSRPCTGLVPSMNRLGAVHVRVLMENGRYTIRNNFAQAPHASRFRARVLPTLLGSGRRRASGRKCGGPGGSPPSAAR